MLAIEGVDVRVSCTLCCGGGGSGGGGGGAGTWVLSRLRGGGGGGRTGRSGAKAGAAPGVAPVCSFSWVAFAAGSVIDAASDTTS